MTAIIYKITSPLGDKVYVGSTSKKYLCNRKADHKSKWKLQTGRRCASMDLFDEYGFDNCVFEKIETVAKDVRYDRERYWVEELKSINYIRPTSTEDEQKKMKSEWFQRFKQTDNYKVRNHNSYLQCKEKMSSVVECECGKTFTEGHRKRHFNSAYHIQKLKL